MNSPHHRCDARDSIPQLASASGKGVEATRGVEDHVKCPQHRPGVVLRKVQSTPFREERRGVFVESDATASIYTIEEEKSVEVC